jgi:hypothetical protein
LLDGPLVLLNADAASQCQPCAIASVLYHIEGKALAINCVPAKEKGLFLNKVFCVTITFIWVFSPLRCAIYEGRGREMSVWTSW